MIGYTNSTVFQPIPCEYINIRLLTNQSSHTDLNGAVFTVEYEGQSKDYTWEGSEVTVMIPTGMEYTVTFKDVEGYKSPESITYIAIESNARDIEALYQTELLTVNVSADEGEVSGFEVTIKGTKTYQGVLHSGYTQLEYIEATGVQYIDTGFKPNQDTRVVASMYLTQNNSDAAANEFFGARTSTSSKCFGVQYNNTSGRLQYFYGNGYTQLDNDFPGTKAVYDANKNILYSNESEVIERSYVNFQCDYNLYLFALNNAGSVSFQAYARLYSCQIYDNGTLVRDYVPAKSTNGVAGLYDKVEGLFYASVSGTDFVGGDENIYTQLEYIEATGTQYIDTGFVPDNKTRIVIDASINAVSDNAALFGCRKNTTEKCFVMWVSPSQKVNPQFGNVAFNTNTISVDYTRRIVYDMNKNVTTVDGQSVSFSDVEFTSACNLYLFALNNDGTKDTRVTTGKLHSCQIYDNGILVRDYVPVLRSDGVAGLYDKVNKRFYESATSTALVAGSEAVETIATQTTASATHKIPFGVSYTVSVTDIDGYITPASQSFVAAESVRSLTLIYEEKILGVFIQDTDGKLWKPEDWDNSATADCVAVLAEECSFGIYIDFIGNDCYISEDYYLELDNYMTGISDVEIAKKDYNGKTNTANMLKAENDSDSAHAICSKLVSPSGKAGFLPSLGQMYVAYNNIDAIDNALVIAGGEKFSIYGNKSYWTSTLSVKDPTGTGETECWTIDFADGDCSSVTINAGYYVRAFFSI